MRASLICILLCLGTARASEVDYEIDRLNKDYDAAIAKAEQLKLPIIVWVNMDDPYEEYSKINVKAVHVFVKDFIGMHKGIVVGTHENGQILRNDCKTIDQALKALSPKPKVEIPPQYRGRSYVPS